MSTTKIIDNLNKIIVTVASIDPDGKIESKVMTLEQRLHESCEQSKLVSGNWIKENFELVESIWDEDDILNEYNIYCLGTECVYDLGNSLDHAKYLMLQDGYISQLSNTQWFDGEDYWETIEGSHTAVSYDEDQGFIYLPN